MVMPPNIAHLASNCAHDDEDKDVLLLCCIQSYLMLFFISQAIPWDITTGGLLHW